jgi:hypothetical protein
MAHIILKPAPMELGLHRTEYEQAVLALEAQGYDVALETPFERRGGPAVEFAYQLVVLVSDHLEDMAIDAVLADLVHIGASSKHRRQRRGQLRQATGAARDFALGGLLSAEADDEPDP